MSLDPTPRLPRGFLCGAAHSGIKPAATDLALFAAEAPCTAAALFTRNHFAGAPVVVGRELIGSRRLQAVVVNSGNSNAGNGADGVERARTMGRAAARALGLAPELVLMSSTGIIGRPLPLDRIEAALPALAANLGPDPLEGAGGMMTTDTHPKAVSVSVGDAVLTLVGKGAGMISPDMATMLVFGFTDARVAPDDLDAALRSAASRTFQMLSVDTDTSTSDTCAIMASGTAGPVPVEAFQEALETACLAMTEMLARDGEGATKLLRATVRGAASPEDARTVARALVDSPLVKTMAYGADPNVGRILMAVGKCVVCTVDPDRVAAGVNGLQVIREGRPVAFDEARARTLLAGDPVDLDVDLGVGGHGATAFGCDLTEGYVAENAAYASS